MTCTFTISAAVPIISGGQVIGFGLQGNVSVSPPSQGCTDLEVKIQCGQTVFDSLIPIWYPDPLWGIIQGTVQLPASNSFNNCCGSNLTVTIGCPSCGYQTYLVPLNCSGGCPNFWSVACSIGQCRFDGTVDLTCSAQVSLGSNTSIDVQWQLDGTAISPVTTVTASGTISAVLNVVGDGLNHTLTLNVVQPTGCPPIGVIITLPACGGCSPINFNYQPGNCNANGTRNVVITAVLTGGSATTPISAQMTGPLPTVSGSNTGSLTLTSSGSLAAGTYTVTVTAGICPPQSYSFTVADCCPTISISHSIGKCNPDGTRNVTYTAVLSGASSTTQITAQMTGPCVPTSGTGTGSLTLTSSCALNTGTYTVTVTAGNCPPQSYTFTIEDCCPTVDFEYVVCGDPECNGQGTRPVHVIAHITPHTGVQTTAQLIDTSSGATLDTGTSSAPFTLTGNGTYTSGTHQITVSFGAPLQCPDQTFDFCVPDCESPNCWWAHFATITFGSALLSLLFLLVIEALATYLAGAYPGLAFVLQNYSKLTPIVNSPSFNGTVWFFAAAFLVSFLLWLLCIRIFTIHIGYCCGSWCIFLVMLWQIPLMTGVILLYVLAACLLLTVVTALILFLVAYLLFRLWQKRCCTGKCDGRYYTFWALVAAAVNTLYIVLQIVGPALSAPPIWLHNLGLIVGAIISVFIVSSIKGWLDCSKNC